MVRDYYLIFLHRVGYIGFHYNTFFISTTLSEDVAKKFTDSKDIIFVSWKTLPIKRKIDNILSKRDLPIIIKNIYIKQNEISVKGALFPQDILGFIDKSTNNFHVNPNLFNYPDLIDYMIVNGIPTDQSNFFEVLKKTNHSGYTVKDEKNYNDNL
ncbi:hypothetical protein NZ698_03090 [Chryseobacterium sp. PBS4-4]|uniref:Uncharacterized protein n=1 Tax=Chryseobacterium edaphi TaxID=2976532 RepID=A0ABT2W4A6_9FLAO|nr:hypothetical protein [Chryseobacterium edaphi]MCU7616174.1 hypothetical protein [Chryseobacterium edaphi]